MGLVLQSEIVILHCIKMDIGILYLKAVCEGPVNFTQHITFIFCGVIDTGRRSVLDSRVKLEGTGMMSGELMKCELDYDAVHSDITAEVMLVMRYFNCLFGLSCGWGWLCKLVSML